MKITATQISEFAYCPAYFTFNTQSPVTIKPETKKLFIIQEVIKKSYLRIMQDKRKPNWKMIMGWVDKAIFKDIDMYDSGQYDNGIKLAESVLHLLNQWYIKEFKNHNEEGYADFEITTQLGTFFMNGHIPLLRVSDPPTLMIISNKVVNTLDILYNIQYRVWMWIICKELNLSNMNLEVLNFSDNGIFKVHYFSFTQKMLLRTEEIIKQIATSIKIGINYASRKAECIECPFYKDCIL